MLDSKEKREVAMDRLVLLTSPRQLHLDLIAENNLTKPEDIGALREQVEALWAEVPDDVKEQHVRAGVAADRTPKQVAHDLWMDLHRDVLPLVRREGLSNKHLPEPLAARAMAHERAIATERDSSPEPVAEPAATEPAAASESVAEAPEVMERREP